MSAAYTSSNIVSFPNTPSDSYHGWQLTYYETHFDSDSGRVIRAESARELLESYAQPRWLNPDGDAERGALPATSKQLKDRSPCVTAAIMQDGVRKHANAGLSRVLFVDFDKSADGTDGLTSEEHDSLYDCLCGLRVAFALHTTTGTQWLPAGRVKLRAVFALQEPVDVAGYQRLWDMVCSRVSRYAGLETLKADHTKRHPGDLFYLPVWSKNFPHFERWHSVVDCDDSRGELGLLVDPLWSDARVNEDPEDAPYARVRYATEKHDALFRAAFRVGALWAESTGSASSQEAERELAARVWPKFREALEQNDRSEPVKDWVAAERTVRTSFERGAAAAKEKRSAAVERTRDELLEELRALRLDAGDTLRALAESNGRQCGELCAALARGGALLHLLDTGAEHDALSAAVTRAIEVNHSAAARKRLQEAWSTGLSSPVDPAAEQARKQLQASAEAMGLVCDAKSGRPLSTSGNMTLIFLEDKKLSGLLSRDVRSKTEEYVVQREIPGLFTAGERLSGADVESGVLYSRFKQYVEEQYGLAELELEHCQKPLRGWLSAVDVEHDPIKEYLEDCLNTKENPAGPCSVEQLETFFVRHGGAEDSPLLRAMTLSMFKSAVKYVYEPGVQLDLMWVLISEQGYGKTRLLQALSPRQDYVGVVTPEDVSAGRDGGRKAFQTVARCWLNEISELQLSGRAASAWKSFISDTRPVVRLSYARFEQCLPRRGVLVAGTNHQDVLVDMTGNRRYLPIELTRIIDLKAVEAERALLWARALLEYRQNTDTNIPEALWSELADVQEDHREISKTEAMIQKITAGEMEWPDVQQLVGLRSEWTLGTAPMVASIVQWKEATQARSDSHLAMCLRKCGWKSVKSRTFFTSGKESRLWVHPDFAHSVT